jgi:thioredoxin reductase
VPETPRSEACDVLVVGGGPAGLTAATTLRARGVERVVVVEREVVAGGVPRHCAHPGFGLRDRHRAWSGPTYARHLVEEALSSGIDLRTSTMVTDWADATGVPAAWTTSPIGRVRIDPLAVVLATGARERPRTARMIPGDRPDGVYTTGQLQNLVHLHGRSVGSRAVVVGSAPVAWSAVLTLREAGCRTVLMVTDTDRVDVPSAAAAAAQALLRVPLARSAEVVRIDGRDRVQSVRLRHRATGRVVSVPCDTVVLTGDWTPESELARRLGLDLADGMPGPVVDAALRTSHAGVFAAGNLLHPVDTADVAALDGAHVASAVAGWLAREEVASPGVRVRPGRAFAWVAPGMLRPGAGPAARGRLLAWPTQYVRSPHVRIEQDGRLVAERALPWPAAPGRVFRLPWSMVQACDPAGGDIVVGLREA